MATMTVKYEKEDQWYSRSLESDLMLGESKIESGSIGIDEETSQELKESGSDIDYLSKQLFRRQDVILNEKWDVVLRFPSRILFDDENGVYCECVLDEENKEFEERLFSPELFKHILPLDKHKPILIKVSSKAGASRIDVYDGKGIVDTSVFDLKDGWEALKDSGLDKPFKI